MSRAAFAFEVTCPKCERQMTPELSDAGPVCTSTDPGHEGEHLDWLCSCGYRTTTDTADSAGGAP